VGEEGRAAFEGRLESTLPLSEYLVRELSEQTDLTHADGRARFAESARPLIAKVPEGVYRELLTARVAEVVGLPAERLQALWAAAAQAPPRGPAAMSSGAAGAATAVAETSPQATAAERVRGRLSAGRGSLVRQAIARVVRFPVIAGAVDGAERAGLDTCEEPGIELLRELLDDLHVHPLSVPAQVLERWADRSGGEHLARLLEREEVLGDAQAAALELKATLAKLADQAADRRLEALEARIRVVGLSGLSAEERQEFQVLIAKRAGRKASSAS
jgi:DNA primase